jgi:hypothetical protein
MEVGERGGKAKAERARKVSVGKDLRIVVKATKHYWS